MNEKPVLEIVLQCDTIENWGGFNGSKIMKGHHMFDYIAAIGVVIGEERGDDDFATSEDIASRFNINSGSQFLRFGAVKNDGFWFWKSSQLFMAAGWLKAELEKQGYTVTMRDNQSNLEYLPLV
jgi:hypothetical protein